MVASLASSWAKSPPATIHVSSYSSEVGSMPRSLSSCTEARSASMCAVTAGETTPCPAALAYLVQLVQLVQLVHGLVFLIVVDIVKAFMNMLEQCTVLVSGDSEPSASRTPPWRDRCKTACWARRACCSGYGNCSTTRRAELRSTISRRGAPAPVLDCA